MNPVYFHPRLYELALRLLYRSCYHERLDAVASEIPAGSSVTDLCAGDCALYRYALKGKEVEYLACDSNDRFLQWAEKKGIPNRRIDVLSDEIPPADCVVMMGSLYQFIPNEKEIIEKMIRTARKKVIITEPVRNLSQSRYAIVRRLARELTRIGSKTVEQRFDEQSLKETLFPFGFQSFQLIAGNRELLACLK